MTKFRVETIMGDAEVHGGGTYQYQGHGWFERVSLTEGYMVSRPNGIENVPSAAMSWRFIRDVVASTEYSDALQVEGAYLGLWQDDNGRWSVDLSEWVLDPRRAVQLGVLRSQRAVWDNAAGTALDLAQMTQFGRAA